MGSPLGGQFEAQCPATVQREEVLRALAAERDGSVGHHLPEPVEAGIARLAGASFADPHVGPQVVQSSQHAFVGPRRDLYGQRSPGGTCDGRSGQGGVATRCDGQWRGRWDPVDLEVDRQPEEVAGLVAARHVAGLVLGPEPTPLADGLGHLCYAEEWRGAKARAVHLGDGVIEAPDEVDVGTVAEPCSEGGVVRPEQVAEPDERIGIVAVLRVGTRPDGTGRGAQPADRAGERHDPERTPVRALNSSIMSSQTGASSWTPFQKPWSRRIS